jgi:hypothetical protein
MLGGCLNLAASGPLLRLCSLCAFAFYLFCSRHFRQALHFHCLDLPPVLRKHVVFGVIVRQSCGSWRETCTNTIFVSMRRPSPAAGAEPGRAGRALVPRPLPVRFVA